MNRAEYIRHQEQAIDIERIKAELAQRVRALEDEPFFISSDNINEDTSEEHLDAGSEPAPKETAPTPLGATVPQQRTLMSFAEPGHEVINLYETPEPARPPVETQPHIAHHEARHRRSQRERKFNTNVLRKCIRVIKPRTHNTVKELV